MGKAVRPTKIAVITYNALDGACAAAMALQAWPAAEVQVTSMAKVHEALQRHLQEGYAELHLCAVGIDELHEPETLSALAALKAQGKRVIWYCGRGYMDRWRTKLEPLCACEFHDLNRPDALGTNTACMAQVLEIQEGDGWPAVLQQLALQDANLYRNLSSREKSRFHPPRRQPAEQFWFDLIENAGFTFFRYQRAGGVSLVDVIRRLAVNAPQEGDREFITEMKRNGTQHMLHGNSRAIRGLRARIPIFAAHDRHVVITGESGTGKEVVAHLLHHASSRAEKPFRALNCAQFIGNPGLADSLLFGHRKGAFTGATGDFDGYFKQAHGGVLFLDEIAQMPLEVQAKLLRAVESKEITPVGSTEVARVDVRIIAAANRDLPQAIREGKFLHDLFFRLAEFRLMIPPLRERPEDMQAIIKAELYNLNLKAGLVPRLELLRSYDWPGNVRQLLILLRRSVLLNQPFAEALAEERRLGELRPPGAMGGGAAAPALWPNQMEDVVHLEEVRRQYAARALELHEGNKEQTAQALGIARNTLAGLLQKKPPVRVAARTRGRRTENDAQELLIENTL